MAEQPRRIHGNATNNKSQLRSYYSTLKPFNCILINHGDEPKEYFRDLDCGKNGS